VATSLPKPDAIVKKAVKRYASDLMKSLAESGWSTFSLVLPLEDSSGSSVTLTIDVDVT
jgi:hypothetical protein